MRGDTPSLCTIPYLTGVVRYRSGGGGHAAGLVAMHPSEFGVQLQEEEKQFLSDLAEKYKLTPKSQMPTAATSAPPENKSQLDLVSGGDNVFMDQSK